MKDTQERQQLFDLPFVYSQNGVGTDFDNVFVQAEGAFVLQCFARPGMQAGWKQDGLAHIASITQFTLGNSDNGTVPMLDNLLLDGNRVSNLLKERILNVVDSGFGKEVVVVIVNKAADVTRRNDDFSVEYMLQNFKKISCQSTASLVVVIILVG